MPQQVVNGAGKGNTDVVNEARSEKLTQVLRQSLHSPRSRHQWVRV